MTRRLYDVCRLHATACLMQPIRATRPQYKPIGFYGPLTSDDPNNHRTFDMLNHIWIALLLIGKEGKKKLSSGGFYYYFPCIFVGLRLLIHGICSFSGIHDSLLSCNDDDDGLFAFVSSFLFFNQSTRHSGISFL